MTLWEARRYLRRAATLTDNVTRTVTTQSEIGTALNRIYEITGRRSVITGGAAFLRQAIDAAESEGETASEFKFDALPRLQNTLANALYHLAQRSADKTTVLQEAEEHYRKALALWTEAVAPYEWAISKKNLGRSEIERGFGARDARLVQKGIRHVGESLKYRTRKNAPYQYAESLMTLARGLVVRTFLRTGKSEHKEASLLVTEAEDVFGEMRLVAKAAEVRAIVYDGVLEL